MVEAAKRAREIAAKELADSIRQADKQLKAPKVNIRTIQQRVSRIEER